LKVINQRNTFKPERNPDGAPLTVPTSSGYKETLVGHVTIVATAIPDSLEKIDIVPHDISSRRIRPVIDHVSGPYDETVIPLLQTQTNNPDQPVSVENLQGSPKPQPRFRRLIKRGEAQ
jgi:hypothetical protein